MGSGRSPRPSPRKGGEMEKIAHRRRIHAASVTLRCGTDTVYCRYQFRFTLHAGHQVILAWFFEAFPALCC
jgi:hypothetical protein